MDEVSKEFKKISSSKGIVDKGKHDYDTTGKSLYYRTSIMLNPKAKYFNLQVSCTDWSKELEKRFSDKLKVSISTDVFADYMNNEAY